MPQTARVLPVGRIYPSCIYPSRIYPNIDLSDWQCAVLLEPCHHSQQTPSIDVRRLGERVADACLLQSVPLHRVGSVRVATLMPSGRPVATIDDRAAPICVSLSHTRLMRAAVACAEAFVGIDLVEMRPATAAPCRGKPYRRSQSLDAWFTQSELGLLAACTILTREMLWAAKEAAYKAARLDTEFRPRQLTIEHASGNRFRWSIFDRWATVSGEGVFLIAADHIVAIAAARMPEPATLVPHALPPAALPMEKAFS